MLDVHRCVEATLRPVLRRWNDRSNEGSSLSRLQYSGFYLDAAALTGPVTLVQPLWPRRTQAASHDLQRLAIVEPGQRRRSRSVGQPIGHGAAVTIWAPAHIVAGHAEHIEQDEGHG